VHFNPDSNSLEASMSITFPSYMLSNGKLPVLMSENVQNLQISGSGYLNKEQSPSQGLILHELNFDTNDASDSLTVNFSYSLQIPADHQINRITNQWIELNLDSFWQPIIASIPRFHYEIEVDLSSGFKLVSGDLITTKNENQYMIRSRFPRLDISFAAGTKFETKAGSYTSIYSSVDSLNLTTILKQADEGLRFYEEYLNQPGDFKNERVIVISPRKDVGYSRKNYIVLSDISE
jgi:hypothetical protein